MNHEGYLTIDEVCALIRECHASNVHRIKIGGTLDVSFGLKPWQSHAPWREPGPPVAEQSGLVAETGEYTNQESLLKDELSLKEAQLAEMIVTDPLEYERLIAEGELVNEEAEPV